MAKCRKSDLLFFLLTLIPIQFILLPISSPADYLPLSWDPNDNPDLAGYRVYYGESSGNYDHIIDVGNVVLYRSSWEPHVQVLYDFRDPYLAKNPPGKSFPYRYSPSIAQKITASPSLKATMRAPITPLVLFSEFLVTSTLIDKLVYLLFMLCYSLYIFSWLIRKHPNI